ncbi:urea transporter [Streptomyces rubellomurinus]|uniref:urea transporter n=1 Tax=Streptomyces rubellomurinus (strain ATCC 31215) TaxID=359131 RepID=UPI0005F186A0|nr:urea transporter [Streptomyces rubellomurinus]
MSEHQGAEGPAAAGRALPASALPASAVSAWAVAVLRGFGQVAFLRSAACGLLFAAALFAADWHYGAYGLLGCAAATAVAHALGLGGGAAAGVADAVDAVDAVESGLYGYNGCLAALACAVLLDPDRPATVAVAVLGAAVTVVLSAALGALLGPRRLPVLTAPFCLVATAVTVAAPGFRRLWPDPAAPAAALPAPAAGPGALTWDQLWHGFLADFGQVFLLPQWYCGLLVLAGLLAASRTAALTACAGSAIALLTAWALGAPGEQVGQGLYGYNGVLTALALCGACLPPGARSGAYALLGAAAATVLTPALGAIAAPSGGHAFTWPFVLTTLPFLAAVPAIPRLRPAQEPARS